MIFSRLNQENRMMNARLTSLKIGLTTAVALSLAACASSSGNDKTQPASPDKPSAAVVLTVGEISRILNQNANTVDELVVELESISDERGRKGELIDPATFASALDASLNVQCSDTCQITKKDL